MKLKLIHTMGDMMIKIAIVDDNLFYINEVKKMLSPTLVTSDYFLIAFEFIS